jgi:CelD/BcsL family acetyltransferase involved in cellulose biosynthesis
MQIIPLTEANKAEWDRFVNISEDAWLFHLSDWTWVCQKAFAQDPFSFMLKSKNNGQVLAVMPLSLQRVKGFRIFLSARFGGYGGISLAPNLGKRHKKKILQKIYDYVAFIAKKNKVDFTQITLPPLAIANLPGIGMNVNPLVFNRFKDILKYVYLIDLNKDIKKLRKGLSISCRNAVRQAEKKGVRIVRAEKQSDIRDFYEMLKETFLRTGAKLLPYKYFELIWLYFGVHRTIANLFFAEYKGERVAASIIGKFRKGAHYWSGASKTDAEKLRPNNLLQWHAIEWAKREGCMWYESGEAHPQTNNEKEQRLDLFKRSFGGGIYHLYQGIQIYNRSKYYLFRFLKNIRKYLC